MKFGVREICDVVLKKKTPGWFGKLYLMKGMPAFYFDTLKTSSLEGAATTVYAQGGKGNPRLIAWEGDRTVTFTMEDALISPESFSILSGAGLLDASENDKVYVHTTQQVAIKKEKEGTVRYIELDAEPATHKDAEAYVMVMTEAGAIDTYYVPMRVDLAGTWADGKYVVNLNDASGKTIFDTFIDEYKVHSPNYKLPGKESEASRHGVDSDKARDPLSEGMVIYVDYYVESTGGVKQIDITPDQFGGSYYLEASTLFRAQDGADYPAEFVIPNCKVQSNFTFTMAPSGDPSTFTFTMDAFPDYTKFDGTKKVIAALQIVEDKEGFGKAKTPASDNGGAEQQNIE
jgi:hypothetical protein